MARSGVLFRVLAALSIATATLAAYALWARPYQLRWGATDSEVAREIPGDDLQLQPHFLATRAITIEASPEDIWPWLVQMGYDRAGYYGYDLLENLGSERGLRSATSILPGLQAVEVGDTIPISAVAHMVIHATEPNRHLIWAEDADPVTSAFTWALYPTGDGRTRLVSRIRWRYHWSDLSVLPLEVFTEFADHVAIRAILKGVRDRVAGRAKAMAVQNLELGTYVFALLVFFVALAAVVLRSFTWSGWILGMAAGGVWLFTWYADAPLWIGAALGLLTLWRIRSGAAFQARDTRAVSEAGG